MFIQVSLGDRTGNGITVKTVERFSADMVCRLFGSHGMTLQRGILYYQCNICSEQCSARCLVPPAVSMAFVECATKPNGFVVFTVLYSPGGGETRPVKASLV